MLQLALLAMNGVVADNKKGKFVSYEISFTS